MTIGIIGGGAAGMAAALAASENKEVQVILLERQARVGKKLSATGNGRCNLTNLHANAGGYHGEEPDFANFALEKFNVRDTLDWFRNMGLFTVAEESGRVYPYSDQANSVVDVLRFALERENIRLETGFEVEKVKKNGDVFRIEGADGSVECDRLIIACGGLAGGDGTGVGSPQAAVRTHFGMGEADRGGENRASRPAGDGAAAPADGGAPL